MRRQLVVSQGHSEELLDLDPHCEQHRFGIGYNLTLVIPPPAAEPSAAAAEAAAAASPSPRALRAQATDNVRRVSAVIRQHVPGARLQSRYGCCAADLTERQHGC